MRCPVAAHTGLGLPFMFPLGSTSYHQHAWLIGLGENFKICSIQIWNQDCLIINRVWVHKSQPYLILVPTATTGGRDRVLFSSRCTFFHREHRRYCFMKVYSENITHKIPYTPTKKPSTPTKIPRKKPSTPTKYWVRQPKYQVRQPNYQVRQPKLYAVLSRGNFCRKFTHFFGVLFAGQKKIWWCTKKDKYEVCKDVIQFLDWDVLYNPLVM